MIEYTLSEEQCSQCNGSGTARYGSEECFNCKGFNPGFRWYAFISTADDEDRDYISYGTSMRKAHDAIYEHAFGKGEQVISIHTVRYDGDENVLIVRPRYTKIKNAQLRDERLRKQREAERTLYIETEVAPLDIFLAPWSANRHAKRMRDKGASRCDFDRSEFYFKKNQALAHLLEEGRLQIDGIHKIGDVHAELLRSQAGYTFHRPAPAPADSTNVLDIGLKIESKPVDATELPDDLALDVISYYLRDKPHIEVYIWPDRRICFNCGATGHISSRCPEEFVTKPAW